jgi:hypothetical protein
MDYSMMIKGKVVPLLNLLSTTHDNIWWRGYICRLTQQCDGIKFYIPCNEQPIHNIKFTFL